MLSFHGYKPNKHGCNIQWEISKSIMEINITDACNLKCPNCQSSCGIAPSKEMMPLEYIEEFVDDSIRLNWYWEKIKIQGGEPTLHPQLKDIIEIIGRYKSFQEKALLSSTFSLKKCRFYGFTNGTNKIDVPEWFEMMNTRTIETKVWKQFQTANVAPVDIPEYANLDKTIYRRGCCRMRNCGPGIGCNGLYYPCMTMYHVDRVFNLGVGVKGLETFLKSDDRKLRDMLEKTCGLCGFFKYPRDIASEQAISPTWETAIDKYNSEPPKLFM